MCRAEQLRRLTEVSHFVAEIANLNPDTHAPYVGRSAFAHKGGIHVAAIAKVAASYQHIEPELVGNELRVVVSELAGRGNVRMRAESLGLTLNGNERAVLQQIKELENRAASSSRPPRVRSRCWCAARRRTTRRRSSCSTSP